MGRVVWRMARKRESESLGQNNAQQQRRRFYTMGWHTGGISMRWKRSYGGTAESASLCVQIWYKIDHYHPARAKLSSPLPGWLPFAWRIAMWQRVFLEWFKLSFCGLFFAFYISESYTVMEHSTILEIGLFHQIYEFLEMKPFALYTQWSSIYAMKLKF